MAINICLCLGMRRLTQISLLGYERVTSRVPDAASDLKHPDNLTTRTLFTVYILEEGVSNVSAVSRIKDISVSKVSDIPHERLLRSFLLLTCACQESANGLWWIVLLRNAVRGPRSFAVKLIMAAGS
jgi:hypothetical protein